MRMMANLTTRVLPVIAGVWLAALLGLAAQVIVFCGVRIVFGESG